MRRELLQDWSFDWMEKGQVGRLPDPPSRVLNFEISSPGKVEKEDARKDAKGATNDDDGWGQWITEGSGMR